MRSRPVGLAVVLAASVSLVTAIGCFKSSTLQASSESSSASSASSSGSSSGPSGYVRDVREATRQWLLSGGSVESLQLEISRIAARRGVSDWEQDEETYLGIGRGLKKAGVRGERYELLQQQLAGPNPDSAKWIQAGYKSESAP